MKRITLLGISLLIVSIPTFAGDYLTNTNQNAAFLRMLARGASISVDGVYSNPAGLAFLPHEGLQLSLTLQSAYQTRDIAATTSLWTLGDPTTRQYVGKASAPVIPSLHAVYKKGDWAFSGSFAITGGGGKASFGTGLPMFDAAAIGLITVASQGALKPSMYDIQSAMEGRQYIYGLQLGASYRINEHLSAFAGARMNYFTGGYTGFLNVTPKGDSPQLAAILDKSKIELDCNQTGWGLTPILGIDAKFGKLNLAAKYEFKANMNIENDTRKITYPAAADAAMASFKNGVNTPNDIPAMLSVAAGYEFLPSLRVSAEYHFFDDKNAGMADGKQKHLTKGTNEYLAGIEWDVTHILTLSGGGQITDYGLSDAFQTDTSFSCDSYSLGFGAKLSLTERLSMDIGYMWTHYKDYTKVSENYNGSKLSGTNVYGRTNKVFGLSVGYRF